MKPIRKTIVNCGVSHVSACVFAKGDDGALILEQTEVEILQYDYSNESLWLNALADGLEKLVGHGIGKGETHFILPGSLLLTKTIRAPRVEESKQRQIVAFELQQKMPYPLAELIWDYQVVEDDGVEQEVLAIAVRPAIAEPFCEKVDALGLSPVELSAASILDYNALRHSLLEMRGEETLVINIGAKSTNLLFINPEGFLIRNIALGGNSLTQHVADSIGVPFAKAEQVKRSFFSGEVAFSSDDPAVQVLEKNAEQFKARLSQEVTRSVVTYKRLKKGKSPTRVFLCGKGSLLPGLPEYLSQKQALAVDYFDPLRSIRIGAKIDPEIFKNNDLEETKNDFNLNNEINIENKSEASSFGELFGSKNVPKDIRKIVDEETLGISLSERRGIDILFGDIPETGVVIDAKKEALRIRKNKSSGQKINSTPSPALDINSGKPLLIK